MKTAAVIIAEKIRLMIICEKAVEDLIEAQRRCGPLPERIKVVVTLKAANTGKSLLKASGEEA